MEEFYLNTKKLVRGLVSIVIPHAGPLEILKKCMEGIDRTVAGDYEVIIVADKCDNETLAYLVSLYQRGVRLVLNQELAGPTAAINIGFTAARGEYICLLSTDVGLAPGWLKSLKDALSSHPEYGWVALRTRQAPGFFSAVSLFTQFAAIYGEETRMPRFCSNLRLFQEKWGKPGTIWENLPVAEPVKLPEVSKEKAGVKVPTSQTPEGIPDYWREFATGKRRRES